MPQWYVVTITQFGLRPVVTRVVFGCQEPAREFFSGACYLMTGNKGVVSFRVMKEVPERSQDERERSDAFIRQVLHPASRSLQ